jgi:site-specific DNA-methyltransferase (adenine-specific)
MNKHLSEVTNEDCMEGMARYPDKYFDLAIVDPPYGIHESLYVGSGFMKNNPQRMRYRDKQWDTKTPDKEYFIELNRVSKNQIIWGGNYFELKPSKAIIAWVKPQMKNHPNFSQWEMAWTSFKNSAKVIEYNTAFLEDGKTFHPTQKPVALYKWLLHNYAKQGDKILDTHLGSGSSRIAAYEMGFDFTAFELDKEYFEAQEKRYKAHIAQLKMELV